MQREILIERTRTVRYGSTRHQITVLGFLLIWVSRVVLRSRADSTCSVMLDLTDFKKQHAAALAKVMQLASELVVNNIRVNARH